MKWLSLIIGVLGIILTVKPFVRSANWFIRLGDFPRLQVLALLAASLFSYLFLFDYRSTLDILFLIALLLCIAHQLKSVAGFTPFYPKEVQDAREPDIDDSNISLLIFNVLMENECFDAVLKLINEINADVVLLAEPDQKWADALEPLDQAYSFKVSHLLDNHYGMMLFSKLRLHDTEIQFIIQEDIPSIHTRIRLRSGDDVAFHGVHPRPPVPEERGRSLERDGELLLVGKAVRGSKLPAIVAGDMNDAAWSYTTKLFKRISGLLDPRIGRGFYNTFHAKYPFFRLPLDHIFHSHNFRLIKIEVVRDSCGSDHFPVFINLSYEKSASAEQAIPVAHLAETEEAEELVASALRENRYGRLSLKSIREKIRRLKKRISRMK